VNAEPQSPTAAGDVPGEPLRGEITWQVIVVGLIVAALMGAAYPYMVLYLGFGPNVSVVAAFFGFLFLRGIDLGTRKNHYSRWQNNLAEAAGTSASQTAFMCILLAAFDILRHQTHGQLGAQLTPAMSFLWLTTACTLGVLLAVPLRRHFIVDEQLAYPDGIAAAETVIVLDPPKTASAKIRANATRAFRAVMIGVGLSALIMAFRSDAQLVPIIPEGWDWPGKIFSHLDWSIADGAVVVALHGVVLQMMHVGYQYSLLGIGSGLIVGLRINMSMMIGTVLAWVVAPYLLTKYGVGIHHDNVTGAMLPTATPTRNEVLFWVMWPATGMLVAGGLTSLALRWRILVRTFKSLKNARIASDEFPLRLVIAGVIFFAIALCVVQSLMLGMAVWMTLAAIVMSLPLMLVGLRVLGETNWGPISALSNMMQGVFALIAPGNVGANMVASGTTGTIATSSEAIMQDYKAGHIIGTKPRNLTIMQLIAVPVGAAAVSFVYPMLEHVFGVYDKTGPHGELIQAKLSAPISAKWAAFAQILKDGVSALPSSAVYALVICTVIGVLFTVLEQNAKLRNFIPSPTAMGSGILIPFNVVFTMFIGGLIGWYWERKSKSSADIYMIPLASGFIAGEALVAVIAGTILYFTGS
jgi:uncharacterized oligopeptide transporter (OPT) family protein